MGYMKHLIEELGGGNPESLAQSHVCDDCFADQAIKDLIAGEATQTSCDFCGAESDEPIAASLLEVALYINECLKREYDDAANHLPWESAEGGYQGETSSTRELLEDHLILPNDDDVSLMDALANGMSDQVWCRKHPFSLSTDEQLNYSWDDFCNVVKHSRRYFFHEHQRDDEVLSPLALLEALQTWCGRFALFRTLPKGTVLYRVRHQKNGEIFTSAADLGPPPEKCAVMPNRMSPPGVVMFYASEVLETAERETAHKAGTYAIGKFRTLCDVMILDVSDTPEVPSIFAHLSDSAEYDPRPATMFLNYFAHDLSKPIARDNQVHVEYVPTQVVTEYFRTEVRHEDQPILGIRYQSARHPEGQSLVLFATQDDLVGVERPWRREEPWIELIDRSEATITQEQIDGWKADAWNAGDPTDDD
jgi:hypothetical protein